MSKIKKNEKVAIVGFAPSWNEAPFEDESFDVWGINELYIQAKGKRFTHWFEIHDPESPSKKTEKHWDWLKQCQLPLYMREAYPQFPKAIAYPRQEVKAMVNKNFLESGSKYTDFSNQITWMILLAIYQGYKEIHVYGVDMAQQSEYAWQRSSCQFALGLAVGKGIKVHIPHTSELCKYPMDYGFETDNANRHLTKTRIGSLEHTILSYKNQIYDIEHQYQEKHKAYETYKINTKNELQKIGDEVVKLDVLIAKNQDMIKFLEQSPKTIEEFNTKKTEVIVNIQKQNELMKNTINELTTKATQLDKKFIAETKVDYMNLKVLEETKENLNKQILTASGALGECKYNLNNNRV